MPAVVSIVAALVLCSVLSLLSVRNQVNHTNMLSRRNVAVMDGTASRPFAYRVLTPALISAVRPAAALALGSNLLPDRVESAAERVCAAAVRPPVPCDLLVSGLIVSAFFCAGFLLVMFFVFRQFIGVTASLAGMFLSFLIQNGIMLLGGKSFSYDFPTLMFAALLTSFLLSGRTAAYYMLLIPAILAKESLILYLFGFIALHFHSMARRDLIRHLALQVLLFAVIYSVLLFLFSDRPGAFMESHPLGHVAVLAGLNLQSVLICLFAAVLLFFQFPTKDFQIKALSVMILPWLALYVIGGGPGELRVAYEILPVLILLVMGSLVALVTGKPRLGTGDLGSARTSGG